MTSSKKFIYSSFTAFCLLCSLSLQAQNFKDIPVKDGKVLFSDTIQVLRNMDKLNNEIVSWLNDSFLKEKGYVVSNDSVNNLIVCRVMEYLEVEKSTFSVFAMYMKYNLILKYSENECIIEIRNLGFIEPTEVDNGKKDLYVFPAEHIFIKKKYKVAFVTDATNKLSNKTIERVNEIFAEIRSQIK